MFQDVNMSGLLPSRLGPVLQSLCSVQFIGTGSVESAGLPAHSIMCSAMHAWAEYDSSVVLQD